MQWQGSDKPGIVKWMGGVYMHRLHDYDIIRDFIDSIPVDKVYPCSIVEGSQSGEIFADNIQNPSAVLFWHYCGFAYIAGTYDEKFISEVIEMMHNPAEGHSGRLALQTGNDALICRLLQADRHIQKKEQYLFEYTGKGQSGFSLNAPFELKRIDALNYDILSGHIVPAFSWKSKEEFLNRGFGYCIMKGNEFVACAFSAGISEKYVDIGVETAEQFKGNGFGKIAAGAMLEEILKRGQEPVWECNTTNEASMRLACAVGFKIKGIHPLYIL